MCSFFSLPLSLFPRLFLYFQPLPCFFCLPHIAYFCGNGCVQAIFIFFYCIIILFFQCPSFCVSVSSTFFYCERVQTGIFFLSLPFVYARQFFFFILFLFFLSPFVFCFFTTFFYCECVQADFFFYASLSSFFLSAFPLGFLCLPFLFSGKSF